MTLKHQAHAGPRPADSSSPTRSVPGSNQSFTKGIRLVSGNAPMLAASSSSQYNHSLSSVDRNGEIGQSAQSSGSYDFLPSVNFDDLQTSIESASTEFKLTQFPSPTGEGSILDPNGKPFADKKQPAMPQAASQTRVANPPSTTKPGRSGSILRRPSTSSRHTSTSTLLSSSSGTLDPSAAAVSSRNRRQSHYPPISNANVVPKPARKSIGQVIAGDADAPSRNVPTRRPSLLGERGMAGDSSRRSIDGGSGPVPDMPRNMVNSRAAKAKSVQPPMRPSQANLLAESNLTPEHNNRLSTLAPRSPRVGGRGMTPSSGGKRASVMPGSHHSSHATGLGARTISPTDTRRMKRLSTMPQSQSLNFLANVPPPPPISMDTRADSRSPSMIPRKASGTPSSSRTTPEVSNRKSYSSGLSIGSTTSFNTVRTSTGSMQPRLPQSMSMSRLPAPKHTTVHSSHATEEDEDVPPVPAIPKAYESPKDSPADAYFMEKRKTGLSTVDTIASFGNSTGSITMPVLPEPTKVQHKAGARKSSLMSSTSLKDGNGVVQLKKQLQPLRLPPLNIGPLNLPTNPKSVAPSEYTNSGRALSPPPSRHIQKTPTTPMTASKSSFFSKSKYDGTIEMPSLRSSSSVHHAHRLTPSPPNGESSDSSLSISEAKQKASISPFLSSSLPKGGFEHGFLKRSKTGGDYATLTGNAFDDRVQQKPAGPREPNTDKPVPKSPTPAPAREEPQTPTSKSSLRRKLSLTWKRGNSKGSFTGPVEAADKFGTHQESKQEAMPPPRIPTSATTSSLSTAKHSDPSPIIGANGKYLESRRRKSSAASLTNYVVHDRVRSDTWASKKEGTDSAMPTTRNQGAANRTIRPRTSMSAMRSALYSAADLDKDDMVAEEEMRKMGSRRKETEVAARALDALRKRATPKERVSAHEAVRIAMLNIYERGEIIDFDDIYFCGTQNAHKVVGNVQSDAPNFGYDDERGDYTIIPGDHLAYRYEIIDVLGKGSFGQVVRCIDHKLGVLVAVKIIRNKKRFHQQALVEVNILQKLREWDPKNRHSMVNFTQHFYFRGHLCISTELLDMNLYEFIKAHSFRGFSLRIIRRFSKQILSSLILLKQRKVIHCDLKPENILLRHPLHSEIKVIDFGSSCFEHEKVYTYIQSRFYRSPEVILGMTYGMPIDMWSVGCILAELYTGVPIFPGENEQEQLACIMEVFGPPEKHLIEKSTRKKLFFDSMGKPRLTVSSKGRRRRPSSKTLQQALKCDDEAFIDFLAHCLRWDPDRRLKPEEAIRHEFITGQKPTAPILRLPARDPSPVKRSSTVSAPRPLPDPPGAMGRGFSAARTGVSPHKPVSGASRRVSGATAATAASINRRTSAGGGSISGGVSGLPRAAVRTASGKQDLAAAGASAAMSRKV
ncbi:Dual-specificity kinase [Purpureocillium takamizusanense]|uniref:Dual-specificity kinase n=1 Tax=Purpureocillium takamizusanense TaxID=2060973 RepID=A0A9Q8QL55_9HYPO|nr:Dual-specificity kinase [Purpureocillium takamizusanense]UNI20774.1 Dual-specificity kinase [Purpureocillium takamizusanense]